MSEEVTPGKVDNSVETAPPATTTASESDSAKLSKPKFKTNNVMNLFSEVGSENEHNDKDSATQAKPEAHGAAKSNSAARGVLVLGTNKTSRSGSDANEQATDSKASERKPSFGQQGGIKAGEAPAVMNWEEEEDEWQPPADVDLKIPGMHNSSAPHGQAPEAKSQPDSVWNKSQTVPQAKSMAEIMREASEERKVFVPGNRSFGSALLPSRESNGQDNLSRFRMNSNFVPKAQNSWTSGNVVNNNRFAPQAPAFSFKQPQANPMPFQSNQREPASEQSQPPPASNDAPAPAAPEVDEEQKKRERELAEILAKVKERRAAEEKAEREKQERLAKLREEQLQKLQAERDAVEAAKKEKIEAAKKEREAALKAKEEKQKEQMKFKEQLEAKNNLKREEMRKKLEAETNKKAAEHPTNTANYEATPQTPAQDQVQVQAKAKTPAKFQTKADSKPQSKAEADPQTKAGAEPQPQSQPAPPASKPKQAGQPNQHEPADASIPPEQTQNALLDLPKSAPKYTSIKVNIPALEIDYTLPSPEGLVNTGVSKFKGFTDDRSKPPFKGKFGKFGASKPKPKSFKFKPKPGK